MSIIRRFSLVVPSLTKHLYKEKESVQIIVGILGTPSRSVIILSVELIAKAMSAPATMLYTLDASTLLVTRLLLVEL